MIRRLDGDILEQLYDAILCIDNKEDLGKFMEDLCTINELFSISQRLEVAKMLKQDKTYLTIAEETGASTATISRVNRALNYGNDMYNKVLDKINKY